MIFLVKGTCTLGAKFRGKDGSTVKEIPATFTSDPNGGSVAVGIMDDDTMEQIGNAEIYGDFDPAGYLARALELLNPRRRGNIPDFELICKDMFKDQGRNRCMFEEYCDCSCTRSCQDCIVGQWIEETKDEEAE